MQYTIARGDSLSLIAARYLGDPARYVDIARLNGISDPNRIYIGQSITLPVSRPDIPDVKVTATKIPNASGHPTATGGTGPPAPRVPKPGDPDYVWPLEEISGTSWRDYLPAAIAGLVLLWAIRDKLPRF